MVKGIDNQIMIHRTAEYARQMAARNDHAENAKEFAAHMEQQRAVHDSQSVPESERAGHKIISREKDGDSAKDGDRQREENPRDEAEEETAASGPETLGNEIDITV